MLVNWMGSLRKEKIVRTDVWYQVLVEDVPKDHVPWVLLKTEKGVWVWGHVDFFTLGKSMDDREISVKGPKLTIEDGIKKGETYWQRIWVRATEIQYMKVTYEPKASAAVTVASAPPVATADVGQGSTGATDPVPAKSGIEPRRGQASATESIAEATEPD